MTPRRPRFARAEPKAGGEGPASESGDAAQDIQDRDAVSTRRDDGIAERPSSLALSLDHASRRTARVCSRPERPYRRDKGVSNARRI